MAINPKEKQALQKMWDESKAPGGLDLPDGKYEFVIVKAKPVMGKTTAIKQVVEVTGGHSDYIGEKTDIWDRLETSENMGWFKKKAAILGITIPKEIELVLGDSDKEGSICQQLLGKKFEGAVVTSKKGDYMNIYTNRFIEDVDLSELADGDAAEEEADQKEQANGGNGKHDVEPEAEPEGAAESDKVEEGDTVTFTSKGKKLEGEVIELVDDGEKARVQVGKLVYPVPCSKCEIVYDDDPENAEEGTEPEAEPEPEPEGKEKEDDDFPDVAAVGSMRIPAIRTALKDAGLDPDEIAKPRELASAISGFLYEDDYKPEATQLKALCNAFGVKAKKGAKPAVLVKSIAKAVQKHFD